MNITELKTALEVLEARAHQYQSHHGDILKRVEALAHGLATLTAIGAEIDTLKSEYEKIAEEAERLQVNTPVAPVTRLEEILSSIQYHEARGEVLGSSHSALEQRKLAEGENFAERLEAAHDAALIQQQAD